MVNHRAPVVLRQVLHPTFENALTAPKQSATGAHVIFVLPERKHPPFLVGMAGDMNSPFSCIQASTYVSHKCLWRNSESSPDWCYIPCFLGKYSLCVLL